MTPQPVFLHTGLGIFIPPTTCIHRSSCVVLKGLSCLSYPGFLCQMPISPPTPTSVQVLHQILITHYHPVSHSVQKTVYTQIITHHMPTLCGIYSHTHARLT